MHGFRAADPAAKLGLQQLKALTVLFFYALPDERGSNPELGGASATPGPRSAAPSAEEAPKTLTVAEVVRRRARRSRPTCAWSARGPAAA